MYEWSIRMHDTAKKTKLHTRKCTPCKGGVKPLNEPEISALLKQLSAEWTAVEGKRLERFFKFKNFAEALEFTNKVGRLAEAQGHHPDIHLSWGKVTVQLWTHKIGGLHENDFILAAGIDRL
jgi:4a-hydroxytetrahydrobiopterin dehydratase